MTLDEAIQHCKDAEKANRQGALELARKCEWDSAKSCQACADEHKQLAEWLTELKQNREKQSHWIDNSGMFTCAHCGSEYCVMMTYCGGCGCRMDGDSP